MKFSLALSSILVAPVASKLSLASDRYTSTAMVERLTERRNQLRGLQLAGEDFQFDEIETIFKCQNYIYPDGYTEGHFIDVLEQVWMYDICETWLKRWDRTVAEFLIYISIPDVVRDAEKLNRIWEAIDALRRYGGGSIRRRHVPRDVTVPSEAEWGLLLEVEPFFSERDVAESISIIKRADQGVVDNFVTHIGPPLVQRLRMMGYLNY